MPPPGCRGKKRPHNFARFSHGLEIPRNRDSHSRCYGNISASVVCSRKIGNIELDSSPTSLPLCRVWGKWHIITTGTGTKPQNKTKMQKKEFSERNFHITIKWGKCINHAVGEPRVIGRHVEHRKYKDSSLRYHGR
jgi:hypothetical protein